MSETATVILARRARFEKGHLRRHPRVEPRPTAVFGRERFPNARTGIDEIRFTDSNICLTAEMFRACMTSVTNYV